ncbi:MAG: NAD(P)-dependent oxidoreductase [Candidatus Aenigmarchaeota archaeon]|nr:NAD(P)-dependent oxidoreductase [Candidatus Aenigmarchaeota archaeon]
MIIFGSNGRLGRSLSKEFPEALTPSHSEVDITDKVSVSSYMEAHVPDVVFQGAAWVDVRGCETDHAKAWEFNVEGTRNVVDAAEKANRECYFVFPSTACVFHGDRGDYVETDTPNPINFYGVTKMMAEMIVTRMKNHLIMRTDFVERAKWRYEGAFTDRYSTSVFADTLSKGIKKMISEKRTGLLHLTGKSKISHYNLARITTPEVKKMKLADVDIPLPRDQSMKSVKGGDFLEVEY